MTTVLPRDPDELLAHAAWVRRLARQLVAADDVDDVAQDALLAAAKAPPGVQSLRAWLGGAVQRLALRRRRDAARRRQREGCAARPEAVASTADLLACVQQQREVAQLLAELEEPFRTVLLLRFFEDLTPAAIALRLGVPAATVRTRLHRGLAMLRERLQRRHGADWRAGLAALAWLPAGRATPWTWWMVAMTTMQKTVGVFAALVLLLGTMWWSLSGSPPLAANAVDARVAPAVTPAQLATAGDAVADPATSPQRVDATPAAAVPPAEPTATLRGRVFDSRGQPFADVPLQLCRFDREDHPVGEVLAGTATRSDPMGAFASSVPVGGQVVAMAGDGYWTLRTTPFRGQQDFGEAVVVVAPSGPLAGLVHDIGGAPLADVRVYCLTLMLDEFPRPLDKTVDPNPFSGLSATTDGDGRFQFADAPRAAGVSFSFTRTGYRQQRLPTLQTVSGFVDVTLQKDVAGEGHIAGVVVDAGGRPVEGAALRYGNRQQTTSAADGSFQFELEPRPNRLLAMRPGFLPVSQEGVGAATPMPLRLMFLAPSLEITGRVVDGVGAPLAGILVNLVDPQRAGSDGSVEKLSASRPEEGLPEAARARTDAAGRFCITGLSERSYRLRAWDAQTAASVQSEAVPAGSREVVMVLGDDAFVGELMGRVTTRDGQGVPGLVVHTHLLADSIDTIAMVPGPRATTDADGRFLLKRVPCRFLELGVSGEDFEYATAKVEDCLQQGEARLVVLRKCFVQVEGRAGLEVQFLDEQGRALNVMVQSQGMSFGGNGWSLREAKSPVMSVAETAVTMVWRKDDRELGRKGIALQPGREHVDTLTIAP